MRAIVELILVIGLLAGGGKKVLVEAHDIAIKLVTQKIQKGLSSTTRLNNSLWD